MSEQKRRADELEAGRRRFLTALSAGQVGVNDRFGRRIEPGMKVLIHAPVDLVFDIAAVGPVLDPHVPPGLMVVTVSLTPPCNQFSMHANQPWQQAVIIGEAGPQPATDPKKDDHVEITRPTLVLTDADRETDGAPAVQADVSDGDSPK